MRAGVRRRPGAGGGRAGGDGCSVPGSMRGPPASDESRAVLPHRPARRRAGTLPASNVLVPERRRTANHTIRRMHATASTDPVPKRVLIVDDNADAAESLADVLQLDGHHVDVARDGRTAIARTRALRPDVVFCDIGLPDVDGYAVARAIRADPELRSTRLVALSGYAQPEDRDRAREAGFDAHLAKPPRLHELTDLLR